MSARLRAIKESLRSGFWAVPGACVLAAVVLALGLVRLDRELNEGLGIGVTFGAGPDGAREVLSAIATSMITFTGLVFSITIVVLVLTSSQFSPRVLRTFLRDLKTQLSLGIFVATFIYAVLVLRTVNGLDDATFVPAVATTVGLGLLLLSVGVFVGYINHIATAIQVTSIIESIGAETRGALERRFPSGRATDGGPDDGGPDDGGPPHDGPAAVLPGPAQAVLPARRSGVVTFLDEQALVRLACAADVVLRTDVQLGSYVPEGAPVLQVFGDAAGLDAGAVVAAVSQARDRSMDQDVAFGFRQLVDIAEKALSPGINDPTTAVQALDELHDLLRRLATRQLRSGVHRDDDGRVRFVQPAQSIEGFLCLALDEIGQYGADAVQVQQRLDALLADVAAAALPEHREALLARVQRRRGAVQDA